MAQAATAKSSWKGQHIALMILGFILFWPLGLAMLAYIIWGEEMREMFQDMKSRLKSHTDGACCGTKSYKGGFAKTGNVAFDDYRKAEMERLEEERRKLEAEKAEFEEFLIELRRVKDQEEFDRFMKNRHNQQSASTASKSEQEEAKPDA
ncbi:MAG: DUF2852 domain-containing protein [Cohaesibacter sp.]|nr:DUF2852 domain-containing protein [Cohaesibacter sp.]